MPTDNNRLAVHRSSGVRVVVEIREDNQARSHGVMPLIFMAGPATSRFNSMLTPEEFDARYEWLDGPAVAAAELEAIRG